MSTETSKALESVQNWKTESHDKLEGLQAELVKEALEKGQTYSKAIKWLGRQKPNLMGQSATSFDDYINYAILALFNSARDEIRDMAMNQDTHRREN